MIRKLGLIVLLSAACQYALADQAFDDNMKKANAGDLVAQNNVAKSYQYGIGAQQDYDKARDWFLKAAQNGNVESQYYLGTIYNTGQGVKQDYTQAISWFEKAIAQNHYSPAQYDLGVIYENGHGVKEDYKKALELYDKAASQGLAVAKTASAVLKQKIAHKEAATKASKNNGMSKK